MDVQKKIKVDNLEEAVKILKERGYDYDELVTNPLRMDNIFMKEGKMIAQFFFGMKVLLIY